MRQDPGGEAGARRSWGVHAVTEPGVGSSPEVLGQAWGNEAGPGAGWGVSPRRGVMEVPAVAGKRHLSEEAQARTDGWSRAKVKARAGP